MAAITWGTGGSLTGINSVEDYFVGAINFLYVQQNTSAKNPSNLQNLSRTISSTATMSGSLTVPATISGSANGSLTITATSYLTGVTWTPPTGGDVQPANEVLAVIDAARRLKGLELDTTKNPTNARYIEFKFSMGSSTGSNNGSITVEFSGLPLDTVLAANGDISYSGKTYLS